MSLLQDLLNIKPVAENHRDEHEAAHAAQADEFHSQHFDPTFDYEGQPAGAEEGELVEELEELHEELLNLLGEISVRVKELPDDMRHHAEAYWLAHLKVAAGGDHGYMADHDSSMLGAIEELKKR